MSATGVAGPQLPLGFHRNEAASFDTFVAGPNAEPLAAVRQLAAVPGPPVLYLWGPAGTGKSHLCQAACIRALDNGSRAFYLPLAEAAPLSPAVCEDLEQFDLVCLDGLDAVAGQPRWEQALLHLYNRLRDRQAGLLMSSRAGPRDLPVGLPDLASRLLWGLVFSLKPMDDACKRQVLARRAQARGLVLPEEVVDFLLVHVRRDLPALCAMLDKLDWESLSSQRRLSVPFVKAVLGSETG